MSTPEELAAEYLNRPRSIDVGSAMSRGMSLVTRNLGLTVGATWVALILAACVHFVPIIGWFAAIVIVPALVGGLELLLVRLIRGEAVTVGDVFAAFNNSSTLLHLAVAGVVVGVFVSIGMMLLVLPGVYLAVCYSFVFPLVLDKHLEFWPAMEVSRRVVHRHWFPMFGLLILSAVVALLGVLAVVVGLIVTVPIAFAAQMCAYEELFGGPPVAAGV